MKLSQADIDRRKEIRPRLVRILEMARRAGLERKTRLSARPIRRFTKEDERCE